MTLSPAPDALLAGAPPLSGLDRAFERAEPADASDLLYDFARLSREALDADHASVLLLDDHGRLAPAMSVARENDQLLWSRFRGMEPLRLDSLPQARDVLRRPGALVVEDAATSGLVPEQWRTAFGIRSLAVAPLVVDGAAVGALVVDHARPHVFTPAEVRLIETIALTAQRPLRALRALTRAAERAERADALVAATAGLNAATTAYGVLQAGMDGVLRLLGGDSCSVHALGDDGARTLASRGVGQPEPGGEPLSVLGEEQREAVLAFWRRAPHEAYVVPPAMRAALVDRCAALRDSATLVLVPAAPDGAVAGFAAAGFRRAVVPEPDRLDAAVALTTQLWQALDRVRAGEHLARRVQYVETLYRLADETAVDPDMQVILQRLAPAIRAETRAEIIDAFLCDPRAARIFSTPTPHGQLATMLRSWRRRRNLRPKLEGDLLVVPMLQDDDLVGVLRLRPREPVDLSPDDERLLLTVAGGMAGVVARAVMRVRVAETERELAVAEERERIARDLHDTLGQQLFSIGLELDAAARDTTDPALRARLAAACAHVRRSSSEVRQAIHALSFLEHSRSRGIVPSLRALARDFGKSNDLSVEIRVSGKPLRLSPGHEEALLRVAHEALANVVKHARATSVAVHVSFAEDRVALVIRDDGTGMGPRADEQPGLHFGLRTMQRRMEEIHGGLDVRNIRPHGVRLHAWVPTS
jgi:signal transduction histidine kinase